MFISTHFSWYFTKKASIVTLVSLLPLIEFSLLNLFQNTQAQQIVIFASTLAFYFLLNTRLNKSLIIIISFFEMLLASSAVFAYSSLYDLSSFLILAIIFFLTFLIFFSSISSVLNLELFLKFRLFYFSLMLGIIITEFYWVLTKFPFNFITSGFILFIVYYIVWEITVRYFANTLSKKSIYYIASFLVLILAFIFIIVRTLLV